jgi:hypothetical protein
LSPSDRMVAKGVFEKITKVKNGLNRGRYLDEKLKHLHSST